MNLDRMTFRTFTNQTSNTTNIYLSLSNEIIVKMYHGVPSRLPSMIS